MSSFNLRSVELFSGLDDAAIEGLANSLATCSLAEGDTLFCEGDPGETAYIVTAGELEIFKMSRDTAVRIAVSGPGVIVGEMSLLTGEPRNAGARALADTELVGIPKASLDALLDANAHAVRALFDVFIARWREQQSRLRQAEHMAQIGVLTAGLAHEMNNPAAAVTRGTDLLPVAIERQAVANAALPPSLQLPMPIADHEVLNPVDRAAAEDDLEVALEKLGVEDAWRIASALVDAGYKAVDLAEIDTKTAAVTAEAIAARTEVAALISEVAEGSKRLSELVAALKSYSFLDQAPVQNVDVAQGIEDTLLILKSKTAGIAIVRTYAPDVPVITAHGSRLNQVWTNLIDNAADAIRESMTVASR